MDSLFLQTDKWTIGMLNGVSVVPFFCWHGVHMMARRVQKTAVVGHVDRLDDWRLLA
jgi:hypothetical protein